jgi:AcrR family transcriptional regulator
MIKDKSADVQDQDTDPDSPELADIKPAHKRKATLERQLEIVDIAWSLLTQYGAAAVTIKNISQAAGISEAAIYRHYQDKHSILMALVDNFEQRIMQILSQAVAKHHNPLHQLKAIMKAHLEFTESQQRIMFAITAESIHFNDDQLRRRILEVIESYKDKIKNILKEAKIQRLIRKDANLDTTSFVFFGMIEAAIIQYALTNYTLPPVTKFNTLWKIFLNGIYESQPDI